MADSARLLQMLEPAVRPVATPAPGSGGRSRPASQPFEARDFEALLSEAQGMQDGGADEASVNGGAVFGDANSGGGGGGGGKLLGPLTGLGRIENATLRQMIAAQPHAAE